MAQDIKGEFEEYIEELVAGISKEIFLEDLKELCDKYKMQLSQYEQLIVKAENAAERMDAFSETEEADIKSLSQNVNAELTQMNDTVQGLMDKYVKLFAEFSGEVNLLNQKERDAFVQTLDRKITEYEKVMVKQLEKEYESLFTQLLQDFENVCQKNDVQYMDFEELVRDAKEAYSDIIKQQENGLQQMKQVDQTVDQNLKAISNRIQEINKNYAGVFQQFSQKVTTLNQKERKEFIEEVQQVLNRYRNTFAEEIAVKYVSISDKFRADLAGIYKEYEHQLEDYRKVLLEVQKNNLAIQQFTTQNIPELQKLNSTVEENLKEINGIVSGMAKEYKDIFGEFSDRVTTLNEAERQKFLSAMKEGFAQELHSVQESNQKIQKEWEEKASALSEAMNDSLMEQKKGYQYDRKIFLQYIGQQMVDFKKNIDDEVKEQQALAEQMQAEHRELEALKKELQQTKKKLDENEETFHIYIQKQESEISQLIDKLQQTQQNMANEQLRLWNKMVEEWNKREKSLDKQRNFAAWKFFMMATNILLVILLAVLVFLQRPWEVFGEQELIILAIILVVIVLLIIFRKFLTMIFISDKDK